MNSASKQGVILAILAYAMWGVAPMYFKLIQQVPALEILAHRIVWSSLLLVVIIAIKNRWQEVKQAWLNKRVRNTLLLSSGILGFNWGLFIWAVNSDRILDASLGYYINPLLNVALGMLFLSERLNKLQYFAVALASTGVLLQLVAYGSVPIVALSLAISFAVYGLIRKTVSVDSITGLLVESLVLLIPAVVYWYGFADSSATNWLANDWQLNSLLMAAGLVTTLPLLCFVAAARRLNYSTLGFFQYIGPSLMFLIAVGIYDEKVGDDRWLTFAFIWTALVVYTIATVQKKQTLTKS